MYSTVRGPGQSCPCISQLGGEGGKSLALLSVSVNVTCRFMQVNRDNRERQRVRERERVREAGTHGVMAGHVRHSY